MKQPGMLIVVWMVVLLLEVEFNSVRAQSNGRPQVSILWPDSWNVLGTPSYVKIKADATSPSGSIAQVQFFAQQTNPIGVVTNPPFTILWNLGSEITNYSYGPLVLTAVATDQAGLSTTSAPANVYLTVEPPPPVLKITSPEDGAVLAAPATFLLSAELLASTGDTGPEEFFVGTNSVGVVNTNGRNETFTLATPPASLTVSNLTEGGYELSVRYLGWDGGYCHCSSIGIQVVKLAAVSPRVGLDGRFEFDVVTSFAGRQTVIEVSQDRLNWTPISTNQPSSSTFTFTDPSPPGASARFYRVLVHSN